MLDTLTVPRDEDDFNTVAGCRSDPGGFPPEARTGAREAAGHMKDLAERFAELRNAIMRLPGNPSRDDRAGLRHLQAVAYQSAPDPLTADPAIDLTHSSRFRRAPVSALNSLMAQWN